MASIEEKLDHLLAGLELGGEGKERLGQLVFEIAHALKNPLSTFGMELYMARRVLDKLDAAGQAGDQAALHKQSAELRAICDNVEVASDTALKLVSAMEQSVASWRDGRSG